MDPKKHIATIDAYIKTCPKEVQDTLKKIRQVIKTAAPKAMEAISYNMPAYKLNGVLVYFAAMKSHIGFYPTPSAIVKFKKELSRYKTSKGAVQFPLDRPIPLALIKRIVVFRVKENLAKS